MRAEITSIARDRGLAEALRRVVERGTSVPVPSGSGTLLPTGSAAGVRSWSFPAGVGGGDGPRTRPHPVAGLEDLELVEVSPLGRLAPEPDLASAAVLAIHLGLAARMLDHAVAHLAGRVSDDRPLLDRQMVQSDIADVRTELELCAALLEPPGSPVAERNCLERLRRVNWTIAALFGASGYLVDHPVRCLHVMELVHDAWGVGRASGW